MDVSELQTIEHDVLVIGAGGAGLRAAIETGRLEAFAEDFYANQNQDRAQV